jgi:hypothetical protein
MKGKPIEYVGPIVCRTCDVERPHSDFPTRNQRRRTECKFCMRRRAQESANRVRVGDARWLIRREGALRRKYGIGNEDFARLLAAQDGRCALCREVPAARRRHTPTGREWTALHIDHCHETGRIRGLLCHRCNTQVGWTERIGASAVLAYLQ